MSRLLYVVGSPRGDQSQSAIVAEDFLATLREKHPHVEVDTLDVWTDSLPEFDGNKAAAKMAVMGGVTLEGGTKTAWDEISNIGARFTSADFYLFTVPMWNGDIPYKLKQYIDIITQPGILFGFDPATGYKALLQKKKAVVVYTSGVYEPGISPPYGSDFQSTYFDFWLKGAGITDITSVRYQPTLVTKDPEAVLAKARVAAKAAAAGLL